MLKLITALLVILDASCAAPAASPSPQDKEPDRQDVKRISAELDRRSHQIADLEQVLRAAREEREKLQQDRDRMRRELEGEAREANELRRMIGEHKAARERLEGDLRELKRRYEEDLGAVKKKLAAVAQEAEKEHKRAPSVASAPPQKAATPVADPNVRQVEHGGTVIHVHGGTVILHCGDDAHARPGPQPQKVPGKMLLLAPEPAAVPPPKKAKPIRNQDEDDTDDDDDDDDAAADRAHKPPVKAKQPPERVAPARPKSAPVKIRLI